ncbi:MAG: hypothetical protein WA634_06430 [Silvibacterium sp.]
MLGILTGVLFAAIIWFVISWVYYLLHARTAKGEEIWEFTLPYSPGGENRFSGLARKVMEGAKEQESPNEGHKFFGTALARTLGRGYRSFDGKNLGSGHSLAGAVLFGLLLLYFLIAYISFPLPGLDRNCANVRGAVSGIKWLLSWSDFSHRWLGRHLGGTWVGFVAFVTAITLLVLYLKVRNETPHRGGIYLISSIAFGSVWVFIARAPHYPAIATIVALLMLGGSILAGLAFFLDRFRVPAAILLMALLYSYKREFPTDHVYETTTPAVQLQADSLGPRKLADTFILERGKQANGDGPMIVVTATGGGIHAAYWTATVLDGLESAFAHQDSDRPIEDRILLMSSASGGSVAVGNWIANHAEFGDQSPSDGQLPLHEAANQPALEAVAWGLLHTDLWRMILPFGRFNHDRAWFLEQANLANLYMTNHPPRKGQTVDDEEIDERWNASRTLGELKPQFASSADDKVAHIPAFSLNATVVETGERFLLSNYVPTQQKPPVGIPLAVLPWHSALSFFRQYSDKDLKVSTAARLSANFPFVSPVARANIDGLCPKRRFCGTFHLADGGYYDNDGVASAIEFLWLAFGENAQPCDPKTPKKRVLLIQIRDSPLPSERNEAPAAFEDSLSKKREISQLLAPVTTVYNSWHVSETMRNQRELSALQSALPGIDLRTVAFSFPGKRASCCWPTSPGNTTLNWRLTRGDQAAIQSQWKDQNACAVALAAWADASTPEAQKKPADDVIKHCGTTKPQN